jgi:hypothetical protein
LAAGYAAQYLEKMKMLKTPKEIKRDILGKFRAQLDDFDQLENLETTPSKLIVKDYWQLLTTQEKDNFHKAVSDLIGNGLICKVRSNSASLRLTEKGADLIF